jgi:hypothetical protein
MRLPEGPVSGRFLGLDASGRLELETEGGRRLIDAGDLYFGSSPELQAYRPVDATPSACSCRYGGASESMLGLPPAGLARLSDRMSG